MPSGDVKFSEIIEQTPNIDMCPRFHLLKISSEFVNDRRLRWKLGKQTQTRAAANAQKIDAYKVTLM
jgi:hypothetical protein